MTDQKVKVWLDTNVLIYALDQDSPFHEDAFELMRIVEKGTIEAYINTLTLFNALFLLGPKASSSIYGLTRFLQVIETAPQLAILCLKSDWSDKEDAYQYECALEAGVQYIITEDRKGFKKSTIEVLSISASLGLK